MNWTTKQNNFSKYDRVVKSTFDHYPFVVSILAASSHDKIIRAQLNCYLQRFAVNKHNFSDLRSENCHSIPWRIHACSLAGNRRRRNHKADKLRCKWMSSTKLPLLCAARLVIYFKGMNGPIWGVHTWWNMFFPFAQYCSHWRHHERARTDGFVCAKLPCSTTMRSEGRALWPNSRKKNKRKLRSISSTDSVQCETERVFGQRRLNWP